MVNTIKIINNKYITLQNVFLILYFNNKKLISFKIILYYILSKYYNYL